MMRLPWFEYRSPGSVAEAARILAAEGPNAAPIAGGTDLLPNMKRRHQVPATLVSLRRLAALKRVSNGTGLRLGAGLTLSEVTGVAAVPISIATCNSRLCASIPTYVIISLMTGSFRLRH